jgi:hypothetical protein
MLFLFSIPLDAPRAWLRYYFVAFGVGREGLYGQKGSDISEVREDQVVMIHEPLDIIIITASGGLLDIENTVMLVTTLPSQRLIHSSLLTTIRPYIVTVGPDVKSFAHQAPHPSRFTKQVGRSATRVAKPSSAS